MERLQTTRPASTARRGEPASLKTDQRLVAAATALLDAGGEEAVTLRAVGHASGISHNAPYKHFKNRDALLAAVATVDFLDLARGFKVVGLSKARPAAKLLKALKVVITFSVEHPARYRLLFNNSMIPAQKGEMEKAAFAAFAEFTTIVKECQEGHVLPQGPENSIAGLLFATMHGLIGLEATGRMHQAKGLQSVESGLQSLISFLSPQ